MEVVGRTGAPAAAPAVAGTMEDAVVVPDGRHRTPNDSNNVDTQRATEFDSGTTFAPTEAATPSVTPMLDQLLRWSRAMAPLRAGS